jgi:hypothetical protein
MTYDSKIRTLEYELKQLEQQISSDTDPKYTQRHDAIISELRTLRKAQWDQDYDRVNLDDDR